MAGVRLYRAKSLSILLALFASVMPAQQPRLPANFSLQVNGQVRYAGSRKPAENVLVRIEAFSGGLISQSTTDRGGKFSFRGLAAMQYIVTVHAQGFQDLRQTVDLLTANSGYLDFELSADTNAVGSNIDSGKEKRSAMPVINANIPASAQDEFEKGRLLLYATDPNVNAAIRGFEKAVSIYPDFLEARILLGLAYMDLKNWAKAEIALSKAVEINPQASTAQFALGEVYLHEKKYLEGISAITEGLKLNPVAAQGHFTLAKLYWEMAPTSSDEQQFRANAENAWKEVSKAIQLDPNLPDAHVLAGNMLLKARRVKDALEHFQTYLKLAPNGELATETSTIVKRIQDTLAKSARN